MSPMTGCSDRQQLSRPMNRPDCPLIHGYQTASICFILLERWAILSIETQHGSHLSSGILCGDTHPSRASQADWCAIYLYQPTQKPSMRWHPRTRRVAQVRRTHAHTNMHTAPPAAPVRISSCFSMARSSRSLFRQGLAADKSGGTAWLGRLVRHCQPFLFPFHACRSMDWPLFLAVPPPCTCGQLLSVWGISNGGEVIKNERASRAGRADLLTVLSFARCQSGNERDV